MVTTHSLLINYIQRQTKMKYVNTRNNLMRHCVVKCSAIFHIINRSFHTSSETYLNYIEKCSQDRSLHLGKTLHACLVVTGLARRIHFASKLIGMYVECSELGIAHQVFDEMPYSNYRRWIVIIGAYAKCGFYEQALDILRVMRVEEVKPNNYVLPSALRACGNLSDLKTGKEIHGLILRNSFEYDPYVCSSLVDMYSKCGFIENARSVFENIVEKDLVTLNALIAGYVHLGLLKDALNLIQNVQTFSLMPNVSTWNILLAGFSKSGDNAMVDELFNLMCVNGLKPDVVSWTSIISGFVQNFKNDEAFVTFKKMMDSRCFPNTNTISSLLSACANLGNVTFGKEIHAFAVVNKLDQDVYVRSALIDMYSKCGSIFQASTLFNKMSRRNTPTWNSMIFGYASHGYCNEAIELFLRMEVEEREKLDHLTFTAALTACSHSGMVELGKSLFKSMQEKYNIKARVEHYACIVDLLARAGKLSEAYEVINGMPMKPDFFVWGGFLGGCRQYGELALAEVAAKRLAEVEPEGAGPSLLSGLYGDSGSWGNVARLKKKIKKRRFKNLPGSWLEAAA